VSTRLDAPQMRGGEPTLYLDGLNDNVQYWTSTVRVEPYLLERIEVLRGPSSMLYGQGTTVGVVNSVSKKPLAEKYNEVGVRVGSYGLKQTQLDSTGPLTEDGKWLYRIVAVLKESETQIDFSRDDRQLIAPSLTWKPDADTEWTFRMKWQKDRAGGDSGNALPWVGTILPNPNGRISRHTFVGEKQADRFNADNVQLGWSLSHRLNEQWQFRQNLRWTDNKNDYAAMDAYGPYLDPAQRVLNRAGYYWKQNTRTFNADQMLEGVFNAGAAEHRVLVGLDVLDYSQQSRDSGDDSSTPGSALTPIDVYNPSYNSGYRIPAYVQGAKNGIKQVGIYVQDQIRYNNWIFVAGLRHDESENWENGSADRNDSANTKRLGAMYKFSSGLIPYLSYSESFQPQANLPTGQKANPLKGEQWEAGFKFEPANSMWRGNVGVFDLREKNRIVQTGVFDFSQKGETKNTGFEAELIGNITRNVSINANYTLTNVDKQLTALPKHRAAVWSTYRFSMGELHGFSVGGGVQYAGNFTDGAGTPTTPSVTLLDTMLAWEGAKWRVALNVSNLTDKEYFTNCWSWETCSYGMGRYAVLSASYRF
jgi:iron complex outermembrane receptor protein